MGKVTHWLRTLWRALGSRRLAIVLLAGLLLALVLAGLFPQMPTDPAVRQTWLAAVALRYRRATGLLQSAGMFDVYHAPWFLALLAAMALNTLLCTIQRLPGLWRVLTRPPAVAQPEVFYKEAARRAEWPVSSLQVGLVTAQETLARHRYRLHCEEDEQAGQANLFVERGRWTQAATLASHAAILALLLVVLARPTLGWQEDGVTLLPGQVHPAGQGCPFAVRAGSLEIEQHPDGQPRKYRIPLAVIEDGKTMTYTVGLNRPLTYQGVSFHLQSYGPAVQVSTPEGTFDLALVGSQARELELAESGLTLRIAYQPQGARLFVEALSTSGAFLGSGGVDDGQQIEVQGTPITFALTHFTVWQVGHDPTPIPAVGVALVLLAGVTVSLWMPRRRLWLRVDGEQAQMVAAGGPDDDFETLAAEIAQACRPEEGIDE